MIKYTYEKKLRIVSETKSGKPIKVLSREHNLHENKILDWVRLYDRHGSDGLKKRPKLRPTPEFREHIVRLILEKGIPLSHVLIDYQISRTALESWVRMVKNHGYTQLHEIKRLGRPKKNMGRPKKKEPQRELDKLQAENLRLRAENALLKKSRPWSRKRKPKHGRMGCSHRRTEVAISS